MNGGMSKLPSGDDLNDEISRLRLSLKSCKTSQSINECTAKIGASISSIDRSLDPYIEAQSGNLAPQIRNLELARLQLSGSLDNSKELIEILSRSNKKCSSLTKKVRMIESERKMMTETCNYVENVQKLKIQISRAVSAFDQKDWLAAATAISIIRELPEKMLDDSYVSMAVPSTEIPEAPYMLLKQWSADLKTLFIDKFNHSAQDRNVEQLTYFFRLFPLIGESDTGISVYSRFICNIINDQSRTIVRSIQGKEVNSGFYALILKRIFDIISTIILQHSKIICRFYGPKYMAKVMTEIQKECDLQCGLIFDIFWDSNKIDVILQEIKRYEFPILVSAMYTQAMEEGRDYVNVSIVQIGSLISELSSFLNHWSMYGEFFASKWSGFLDSPDFPKPLLFSSFEEKVTKNVCPTFDKLSIFYLRRSLEKAYEIEELPDISSTLNKLMTTLGTHAVDAGVYASLKPHSPLTTSIIEDIILVLKNVLKQSLLSGQLSVIKSMVTNARRIVENDLLSILKTKLSTFQPRANTQLLQFSNINEKLKPADSSRFTSPRASSPSTGDGYITSTQLTSLIGGTGMNNLNANVNHVSNMLKSATTALNSLNLNNDETNFVKTINFMLMLNSIEAISVYFDRTVQTLVSLLDQREFSSLLVWDSNEEKIIDVKERVTGVLTYSVESLQKKTDALLNINVDKFYQLIFKTKLSRLVNETFRETDFLISSHEWERGRDHVLEKFIKEWTHLIVPFYAICGGEVFNKVINQIAQTLAQQIEAKIWLMNNKINELGAIRLEKYVSAIISELSKISYSLRERFVRVTQIVLLLSYEADDDEEDSLAGIEWILTPAERNNARYLRVDKN